ncbi:unnamed protein product [Ilex paraguariensis]|uniref:Protein kinase domain-containing protein n=1 Tax=Ilex paraguariensis TaxID=185542 RepID=A0ABC8QLF7_9AQUA
MNSADFSFELGLFPCPTDDISGSTISEFVHKQWVAEVQFLGVVEHPNLVKFIGYCTVDGERGIQRLLILRGAAQGLSYLHEEFEAQVIYRAFKSSNVLLDEDFKPKLSDFGLARGRPTGGHSHVSTVVVRNYGYAAPDYIQTGHLTTESDVWCFRVVLYEVLTGRQSLERNRPISEQTLLHWVKQFPADSKKFGLIMDPRLDNRYSLSAARKIAKLADSCLLKSAKDRPKMSLVLESLKQIIEVSDRESHSNSRFECVEDDPADASKNLNQMAPPESTKRRLTQLAKLGEHGGRISRRGFLIMHRTKVP